MRGARHALHPAGQDRQRVVRMGRQRLPGDLRGHERVPVAVTADPAAEPDEGRHRRERILARRLPLHQRRLDDAVQPWDRPHQRVVEDAERGLHLVRGGRLSAPQRGRALQDVDVLQQPAAGHRPLRSTVRGVAEAVELLGDAAQCGRHGATPGLGRVRREDGVDPEPLQVQLRVGADGVDRRPDVPAVRSGGDLVAPGSQRAGPVPLVGEVREVQVDGHGASQQGGRVGVQAGHDLRGVADAAGPARVDETVHHVDQPSVTGLVQHLRVQRRQQVQVGLDRGRRRHVPSLGGGIVGRGRPAFLAYLSTAAVTRRYDGRWRPAGPRRTSTASARGCPARSWRRGRTASRRGP